MKADGASHEEVVVLSGDGSVGSVLLSLVGVVLVEAAFVALDVEPVAHDLDKGGDNHRLC